MLYRDNGKENGDCYVMGYKIYRVQGLGLKV